MQQERLKSPLLNRMCKVSGRAGPAVHWQCAYQPLGGCSGVRRLTDGF